MTRVQSSLLQCCSPVFWSQHYRNPTLIHQNLFAPVISYLKLHLHISSNIVFSLSGGGYIRHLGYKSLILPSLQTFLGRSNLILETWQTEDQSLINNIEQANRNLPLVNNFRGSTGRYFLFSPVLTFIQLGSSNC